jgi:hypothetical protein
LTATTAVLWFAEQQEARMAEHKTGMTTAEKALTFIPLAAVCIYVALLGTRMIHPTPLVQTDSDHNPYVFTINPQSKPTCDVSRAIISVSEGDTITFHSFDSGGKYQITFDDSNSPFTDSGPIYYSDKQYTIKSKSSNAYYGYSMSNNGCTSIQYIGIIVTH